MKTDVTTDKVVVNRSDRCLVDYIDGLVHYSVIVEEFHPSVSDHGYLMPPFCVLMCEMIDAFDHATGWTDLVYPPRRWAVEGEILSVPTCVRCMAA